MLECQHCGEGLPRDYLESLEAEYVAHNYPDPMGDVPAQATEYYCSTDCAAAEFADTGVSDS